HLRRTDSSHPSYHRPHTSLTCPSTPSSSFFFKDAPPTELYPLSLHDALPICVLDEGAVHPPAHGESGDRDEPDAQGRGGEVGQRSEEHTSELQSRENLVCRLLLEKKKLKNTVSGMRDDVNSVTPPSLHAVRYA